MLLWLKLDKTYNLIAYYSGHHNYETKLNDGTLARLSSSSWPALTFSGLPPQARSTEAFENNIKLRRQNKFKSM